MRRRCLHVADGLVASTALVPWGCCWLRGPTPELSMVAAPEGPLTEGAFLAEFALGPGAAGLLSLCCHLPSPASPGVGVSLQPPSAAHLRDQLQAVGGGQSLSTQCPPRSPFQRSINLLWVLFYPGCVWFVWAEPRLGLEGLSGAGGGSSRDYLGGGEGEESTRQGSVKGAPQGL